MAIFNIMNKAKERIYTGLVSVADKGANIVARASNLSSEQLNKIEERRDKYMNEKPETDPEGIKRLLGSYAIEAFEAYLPQISSLYEPIPLKEVDDERHVLNRIRFFEIAKWVTDSSEDSIEKLINVYQVISRDACNMALIYNRKPDCCKVYIAVVNTALLDEPMLANSLANRIQSALKGNFPGSELKKSTSRRGDFDAGVLPCLKDIEDYSVASVSNIATEKSDGFLNQSMEKLLDGICPKDDSEEYTIVLLATPMSEQLNRKNALSELYSKLAPYASWQTNFTYTEHKNEGSSATFGTCLGTSVGRQTGTADMEGSNSSHSTANTQGTSHTKSESRSDADTLGVSTTSTASAGVSASGVSASVSKSVTGSYSHTHTYNRGTSDTLSKAQTISDAIGKMSSITHNVGLNIGMNFGVNFSRSSNVSVTIGKNEGLTQNFTNHGVKYTLETLEKQIKRLEESSALGMWDFSAYFISKSPEIANNAAHMYLSLTQGDESYLSQAAVNLWSNEVEYTGKKEDIRIKNEKTRNNVKNILAYLKRLQHPQFQLIEPEEDEWLLYPPHVSTTVCLTGRELARSLNFPKKSVSGLPVIECATFGREIHKYKTKCNPGNTITLGNIYHMHNDEELQVRLDVSSLASHTFITGSTGTGKTNTVYQLISKVKNRGIRFLVIEPAKGEYKKWFGADTNVFGTNPNETDLLYLNPFSFPHEIHVLEHIDRLVEILNACWPMYAAMPAVLKDSIERVYINKGWNLQKSKCASGGKCKFPTFADLLMTLPEVMIESDYSADTKSDYSGALITRIKSLTNGLNGQILCSGIETDDKTLFEDNTIIDLSRIGSTETKALFMGLLIMKLQEYHMSMDGANDEELRHLTILEEAHNLLRRTSVSQSQEQSNLQGKSVEMLTNSIAEMRSFGEGFVIVDQSPGLLDEAVIRNTNTKILLRLPDADDRNIVGKSVALNENQINEIAKLPKGVAVIYQNDWVEAVLCHFEKYDTQKPYVRNTKQKAVPLDVFTANVFRVNGFSDLKEEDIERLLAWIETSKYARETKRIMAKAVRNMTLSEREKQLIAYNIFEGKTVAKLLAGAVTEKEGIAKADDFIRAYTDIEDNRIIDVIRLMIIQVIIEQNSESELSRRYIDYSGKVR